ncbi:MAG: S49 family peptidase [Algisphaera sp.]
MRNFKTAVFLFALTLWATPSWSQAVEPADAVNDAGERVSAVSGQRVGWITLDMPLRSAPVPFAWVPEADAGPSLAGVLAQIDRVRTDDAYPGLVVFLDQPPLSLTQCTAIADALLKVKEAGKTVMVFAEAYELKTYLIASAADSILMQHKGGAMLMGLAVEEMFLADTLQKVGVKPDFIQIGRFKGADEQFMRNAPSEAWSENFDGLLDGLYGETVDRIAANRGWTREDFEALMAGSFAMTDDQLLKAGLVDRLVSRDLTTATEVSFGDDWEWDTALGNIEGGGLDTENPFAMFSAIFAEPSQNTTGDTLAVIHADGPIYSGESSVGGGMMSETSIGSRTMATALEDALLDDNVKGVVIRLDSPGGSALASEVIWQAVRELQAEKPVYAVVQGMAASGGYYIVCAADEIYVQPHSIVGSIGVVAGKMTLGGLYDWAGVKVHRRTRGPGADIFNSVEPFTDAQRTLMRNAMTMTYEQFRERVATGRGDRLVDLDAVDEGMLFTGAQALENGMADRAGGLTQALEDLAQACDLEEGDYDVLHLPSPMPLGDYLNSMFGSGVQSPAAGVAASGSLAALRETVRRVVGPAAFGQAAAVLDGLMLLQREPVLTLMPAAIVVR